MAESFDVVVPCYNEAEILERNVLKLLKILGKDFGKNFTLTIADNASTDTTFEIAKKLAGKFRQIRVLHLRQKGRGIALRKAWLSSNCQFLAYIDADLSYNPERLKEMLRLLQSHDLVNSSRYLKNAKAKRFAFRGFLSRSFVLLVKFFFKTEFTDFQAGFKGLRKSLAEKILQEIEDNDFFFDTELLLKAEKANARIAEMPCSYCDLRKSTVKVFRTSASYFFNLLKLRIGF